MMYETEIKNSYFLHRQRCDNARDLFRRNEIDRRFFRTLLSSLGYTPTEIDCEIYSVLEEKQLTK